MAKLEQDAVDELGTMLLSVGGATDAKPPDVPTPVAPVAAPSLVEMAPAATSFAVSPSKTAVAADDLNRTPQLLTLSAARQAAPPARVPVPVTVVQHRVMVQPTPTQPPVLSTVARTPSPQQPASWQVASRAGNFFSHTARASWML